MTAKVWIRISSVLTLLFCAAHSLGYPWVGGLSAAQLSQMSGIETTKVMTQGFARSYADFHKGFGFYISAMLLVQSIVLWQLGALSKSEPRTARFVTGVFAVLFAATVVLDYFYFFWGPIFFSALITATLIAAFAIQSGPRRSNG